MLFRSFDPHAKAPFWQRCRSLGYYQSTTASGECQQRLIATTIDARLMALDARTGKLCPGFGNDGTVSATVAGQTEPSTLGQLQVATFANPGGLQSKGDNYLLETAASGTANLGVPGEDGRGIIRQGMLEASNVNVVEELVDMIECQRA